MVDQTIGRHRLADGRWGLRPNLQQLGVRASNLGTNATGAANLVSDADGEGAAVLRTQTNHAEQQRSWLLRPVDAPR
ncbi:hypothetical protein JQS43_05080 [Natronosporangium hydrolyticum]|uniref:Uncharacterized protein n=1 Tax=Natronosporangium hydrolyticum TaxID=2811111 RepID=A0A895YD26_9ACTN|nr:hypothetical protein [Natronosporangium hydrolyticum]QSB15714.1 hypothetical protein JQS43_05080 [Natronosporangium hydrolyticum]